jgi:hypothetical protein
MSSMKLSTLLKSSFALVAFLLSAQQASAADNCNFLKTSTAWVLQGACQTDSTIVVPNGITLNGQSFRITAKDPVGGNFQGPILTNGGSVFNISNLTLRTDVAMADVCNTGAGKLVGILLDNAASTIVNVNILMNKAGGTSLCEEGVAIRAQATGSSFKKVTIKNSIFNGNQLAAVEFVGSISGRVEGSTIKGGDGLVAIPKRGIVVEQLAKAYITTNTIIRHRQGPLATNPSFGVLFDNAGQSTIVSNTINFNDIGVGIRGGSKVTVRLNTLRSQTLDGILLTDVLGIPTTGNTIWANDVQTSGGNGIYVQNTQNLTTKNTIKNNLLTRNGQNGLLMEGLQNKAQANNATLNSRSGPGFFDIADMGSLVQATKNLYSTNICQFSFFTWPTKVNCPTP